MAKKVSATSIKRNGTAYGSRPSPGRQAEPANDELLLPSPRRGRLAGSDLRGTRRLLAFLAPAQNLHGQHRVIETLEMQFTQRGAFGDGSTMP